jgi:hypothetical protein
MRQTSIAGIMCLAIVLLTTPARGQSPTGTGGSAKSSSGKANVSARLEIMERALEAQQQQIRNLENELKGRDAQLQQLQRQITQTQAAVKDAVQESVQESQSVAAKSAPVEQLDQVKRDVDDLKGNAASMAFNLQETQKTTREQAESPLALHFKGVTITPGGFMAFETVYRNRALGADINTPFNSIQFPGSGQNALSEFYASGRQSRISLLAEGKLNDINLSGYVEADFLSAGVTSNNNESNSYTLRQRQVWGQASYHNWMITGGQMWSLVTETKRGLDNRSEALPMTIDPQYTTGFSWARQPGFRIVGKFNNHFWVGAAVENPSTTFAARGNAANFALGGPGNAGGLYNSTANYSFNATPDVIVKVAFEPGFGHYELFAIGSRFRDRVYPCAEPPLGGCNGNPPSAQSSYVSSRNGAGFGANARITMLKQLDLGVHVLAGNGVGRYGTAGLPDATVNADGTLALLRSYQALGTLEWHTPRFDWYMNAGEEYIGKRWEIDPISLKPVGYGSPLFITSGCFTETLPASGNGFSFGPLLNCNADTQRVIEGTVGFWLKLHSGLKGRLQFGPQYSYVSRNAWAGTGGTPKGIENIVMTSFQYYLP